jgi:hypothetical protein
MIGEIISDPTAHAVVGLLAASAGLLVLAISIPYMRLITLKEFKESVGKFYAEALCKPCQPLGCTGMFYPWRSGNCWDAAVWDAPLGPPNWKGALQQWLVWVLIVQIMTNIFAPYWIPVHFFFTWSLWFALTQRERSAVPAHTCGIPFGCLVCIVIMILFAFFNAYDEEAIWPIFLLPCFGCLCTSCFVIEHERAVMLLGLVEMALGLSIIVLVSSGLGFLFFWLDCIYVGMGCLPLELPGKIALFIFLVFLIVVTNLPTVYMGACVFMIGWEGSKAASQGSPVACPEPAADAGWIGPCGNRNAAGDSFCTRCGTPKPEQPGALEHKVGKQAEYPTIEKGDVMA